MKQPDTAAARDRAKRLVKLSKERDMYFTEKEHITSFGQSMTQVHQTIMLHMEQAKVLLDQSMLQKIQSYLYKNQRIKYMALRTTQYYSYQARTYGILFITE